jgi:hypothetical protein
VRLRGEILNVTEPLTWLRCFWRQRRHLVRGYVNVAAATIDLFRKVIVD